MGWSSRWSSKRACSHSLLRPRESLPSSHCCISSSRPKSLSHQKERDQTLGTLIRGSVRVAPSTPQVSLLWVRHTNCSNRNPLASLARASLTKSNTSISRSICSRSLRPSRTTRGNPCRARYKWPTRLTPSSIWLLRTKKTKRTNARIPFLIPCRL